MQQPSLEDAVNRVIDQVVKIERPDGGSGTGVYLSGDEILTCLHVVDGAAGLFIRFRSGEQIQADVVAMAPGFDLALLHLRRSPESLSQEQLSGLSTEIDPPRLGEMVVSIGHPLNLEWAVAGGHFNGLRQPDDPALKTFGMTLKAPLVQVDVAINPGNSGGPLIDNEARLVGICTSILNPALVNNIGFAIDASTAWDFVRANTGSRILWQAYDDGHHHPPNQSYDPGTGRPILVTPEVSLEEFTRTSTSCSACGAHYASTELVCPNCGKPNPSPGKAMEPPIEQEAEIKCPTCGSTYAASHAFCPGCGRPRPA